MLILGGGGALWGVRPLGQTLEIIILEGLGPEIGNVDIWGGGWGQI